MIAACHATGWFRVFLLVTALVLCVAAFLLLGIIASLLREMHRENQRR